MIVAYTIISSTLILRAQKKVKSLRQLVIIMNNNVINLPTEHQGVHKNLFRKCLCIPESLRTEQRREEKRTNNKLNPHLTLGRTQETTVRGKRSHHCAIPAPSTCSLWTTCHGVVSVPLHALETFTIRHVLI